MNKPPAKVDSVLYAIMILLGKEPTWAVVKKELASPEFLNTLKFYDKTHISQKTLLKIEKFTSDPVMTVKNVENISIAAACMWSWVKAMEDYAKAFKDIEPKRQKVNSLKDKLKKSEEDLAALEESQNKTK